MPATSIFFALSRLCGLVLLLTAHCLPLTAQVKDFTRWVDPFVGTGGHGHTFPGAVMPFGMVQLSPDTREANWDGSSGYHYSDDIIYGFSHTHLSGTGIPDGCDILFMPTIGEAQFFAKAGDKSVNGYASKFSHANEKAEPGYYSVKLDDDGILAEMTTTKRVGLHRHTFPQGAEANIIVDLLWRDQVLNWDFKTVKQNQVEGFRKSSSWAKDQTVYFVAEFSRNFTEVNLRQGYDETGGPRDSLKAPLAAFRFGNSSNNQILLKVGISFVSIEGARKNLESELPGWDFDKVRADAKAAWNKELSKIEVSGGTDAQTKTFYTALYHTMIHPSIFNDVDGNYRGLDGKIHNIADDAALPLDVRRSSASPEGSNKIPGGSAAGSERRQSRTTSSSQERKSGAFPHIDGQSPKDRKSKSANRNSDQYTIFSLWDTFRAAHPLYTIIDQKRTVDFINSFIRMYEQGGRLPVWELWGNETDTMIGYHAVSVIADAMAKGIKGFDYEKAYAAAKHSAELDHYGLAAYKKRGYISMEDENESVSKTLEYAYNDSCIAEMAQILAARASRPGRSKPTLKEGKFLDDLFGTYIRRAHYFQNLFDPETGFMRPKQNGGFVSPFAPNDVTFNYTEGNAWQYTFFVPHDPNRLMELMGGHEKFAAKLDELFTTEQKLTGQEQPDITGLIGQYAHGNEPSHHIPYLFNYARQPWKTQKYVRKIMDEFYKPTPDGLIGNEDCGQMSAWYVLSASGFYPVEPGEAQYELGSPLFSEIKFNLENGENFRIVARRNGPNNKYINAVTLNGKQQHSTYIVHEDIWNGGTLELDMDSRPNEQIFYDFSRNGWAQDLQPVPVIEGPRSFYDKAQIRLTSVIPNAKLFYTLDGSVPSERSSQYSQPFDIDKSGTIRAIAVSDIGLKSLVAEARFYKRPNDWTVKLDSKYNRQYTGGGDNGLIDGIRGSTNFASGEWQGYQAQDFVATIDLQKETEIKKVGGGFLQVARSWIWMPTRIEFEVSSEGTNFTKVADIKTDIDAKDMEPKIRDYVQTISPVRARYVRVRAYNLGKIPAWHPGAGDAAFIFVDEILIN